MSNPWSLAGMIEEKRLKSTFVIASLCSTLINTFSASMNLWDKVAEKRKQKKKDSKQDDEIRQLKEQVAQVDKRSQKVETDSRRMHESSSPNDEDGETLSRSLARSEALIRREYNDGAGRLGKRYAMGDLITENQLQAQIITLQRTVIDVLQEALVNRHSLSHGDVQQLIAASLAARNGSLDALRQQYQRISSEACPPPRSLTSSSHHTSDLGAGEIFCKYSLALQNTPGLPLSAPFALGGDGRCHVCRVQLDPETTNTYWHIEKRAAANARDEKGDSTKEYHFDLGQRFIIKCHTERGEYACVLCRRHGDIDVVCRSVPTLVNHVSKEHAIWELDADPDLRKGVDSRRALPPPQGQDKRQRLIR